MRVLTVNAGSSSVKLRVVVDAETVEQSEDIDGADAERVGAFASEALELDAVAHRVVHGGPDFAGPVVIDSPVRAQLEALRSLAPLHSGPALAALDAVTDALPAVRAVACFDTTFHRTIAEAATTYALPEAWRAQGVRRYGFHGLAHSWASRRVRALSGGTARRHLSCHLGSGASLCAIRGGQSIDTTMGFTPLPGLVMGTRPGDLDPGITPWLQRQGLTLDEVDEGLAHGSGLRGLCGDTSMRKVEERAARGDLAAVLARDVYVHRLRAQMAAMIASLEGVDVITFSGGVGEHDADLRARACTALSWCGISLDAAANVQAAGDAAIGRAGAPGVFVVEAREELEMARDAEAVLRLGGA